MREFREERQGIGADLDEPMLQQEQARPSQQSFRDDGPIPEVSDETGFAQGRTPGMLAWGTDEEKAQQQIARSWQAQQRTLRGKYGTYTIDFGPVPVTKGGETEVRPKINIDMTPDPTKVTSRQIGFLQVTRFMERGADDWSKDTTSKQMSPTRVARTDSKTGYRVDRLDTEKTPFYASTRNQNGELTAGGGSQLGAPGGAHPVLRDRPDPTPGTRAEFIATATDTTTGQQYDAISWGYSVDTDGKVTMTEPTIIESYDERLIGRDRAIHQWNGAMAGENGVEKAPMDFDPLGIADDLKFAHRTKDVAWMRRTLSNADNRTPEHREKVKLHYQTETGHSLAADLKKTLDAADEKRFKDWL